MTQSSSAGLMTDRLILDIAHAALAASFAIEVKQTHIPGDQPEDHEDNTFGLPEGAPVRRRLRRFFRDQLKHVLSLVRSWRGVGVPHSFPRMADYNDPMASAMTPIIGAYWDKAGKGLRGRLGLDPDEWRVTDPNIHRAIQEQCLKFCASTNATTDLGIAAARDAVRDKLALGLIGEGKTIPELTREIQQVFTRASKSRAQTIARTETARAVHAAAEMSAIESGVVSGKRIMLSANSCPLCVAVAERAGTVPLGGSFGIVGHDADYSNIRMPPIHPNCRCSVALELVDPTKNPVPAFVPSAESGHPAAVIEPEKPKPGGSILPDRPIAERLAAYTEGDRKVKAIIDAIRQIEAEDASHVAEQYRLLEQLDILIEQGPNRDKTESHRIADEVDAIYVIRSKINQRKREAVIKAIAPDPKQTMPIVLDHIPDRTFGKFQKLSGDNLKVAEDARSFLGQILSRAADPADRFEVKVAQLPKSMSPRAFYQNSTSQAHLKINEEIPVAIHEIGHGIDHKIKAGTRTVGEVSKEFLDYRVGSEPGQEMKKLFPGHGYKKGELGRKDRFDQAFGLNSAYYVGKDYSHKSSSEITSMGLQLLYEDPVRFAEKDPEYLKFILGILDGSLR